MQVAEGSRADFRMRKTLGSRKREGAPGSEADTDQERPRTARRGPRRGDPVDKEKVSAALRDLAAEYLRTPRSETARLRDVLDDLEAALTAGASHAAVLKTLHAQGFTFTLRSFEGTLARLRKERRRQDALQEAAPARRKRA
jgi:hypothetical protein